MSATIQDLPGALLGRILGLCGQQAGRSATLVSKHWHTVFYSEPSLWRSLRISGAQWPTQYAGSWAAPRESTPWCFYAQQMAQRVADLVQEAQLDSLDFYQPGGMLRQLQPGVLKSLGLSRCWRRYQPLPPELPELCAFTALTALSLHDEQLPSNLERTLVCLQQLRQLTVADMPVPEWLLRAAAQLTQLTALRLSVVDVPNGTSAALMLRSLTNLRQLTLGFGGYQSVVVPPPASFPHLHSFDLRNFQIDRVEGARCIAALLTPAGTSGGSYAGLQLAGMWGGDQQLQFLSALLPPSLRLVSLQCVYCNWKSSTASAHLSALTRMELASCFRDGHVQSLPELVQLAPGLHSLAISHALLRRVDDMDISAIAHLTCLTRLELPALHIAEGLPPGPYLEGLLELDLSRNDFERVPPVLAAATQLRTLDLSECFCLQLNEKDARLPALQHLLLGRRPGSRLADNLPLQQRTVLQLLLRAKPGLALLIDACDIEGAIC